MSIKWYYLFFRNFTNILWNHIYQSAWINKFNSGETILSLLGFPYERQKNSKGSLSIPAFSGNLKRCNRRQYYGINWQVVLRENQVLKGYLCREVILQWKYYKFSNTSNWLWVFFQKKRKDDQGYFEQGNLWKVDLWPSWSSPRKLNTDLKQWHHCLDKKRIYSKQLLA